MIRALCLSAALWAAVVAVPPAVGADKVLTVAMGFLSNNRGNPYQGITLPAVFPHHAVYDTLTTLDRNGQVTPALALSWSAETPDRWVFKLRPGVTFTNGELFTADALVASAEHMNSAKGRTETIGSQLFQVVRAERVDDLTVRVYLSESDGLFPLHASSWRVPAPRAYADTPREIYDPAPVGSGPFKVVSWAPGKVILVANRASWRAPKLDRIEIAEVPDETARLQSFLSGSSIFAMGIAPDNKSAIEQTGGIFRIRMTSMVHFLGFNTGRDTPLKDKRVRLALNLGINRDNIIREVLSGSTRAAGQLSIPGAFGYAEAGYADGLKLTIGMSAGLRPSDAIYAQQIAADLARIGVDVEVLIRTQQKQQLDMFTGKLDVDMFTMFTRGVDAIADYRHRTCLHPTPGRVAFHCDPAIVDVARAATAEPDPTRRAALYRKVATMEQDSPPGLMLWQGAEIDALSPKITGYDPAFDLLRLDEVDLSQ